MDFRLLRETTPFTQLIFTALIVLICGIGVMMLAYLIGWTVFGIGLNELESAITDLTVQRNVDFLKVFQAMQTIGLFILPPFIVAFFLHNNPRKYLYLDKWPSLKSLILVVTIVIFANPLISWLSEINLKLELPVWLNGLENWMRDAEDRAGEITEVFLETKSVGGLMTNIFFIGVLPAIGEELLFRGVLQQLLKRITGSTHTAIWISAAIFSALHVQFFGFLPRLILGGMFGYMLEFTGSLWVTMIAHFVNNASAVIVYYFSEKGISGESGVQTNTNPEATIFSALISLVFVVALFRMLYTKPAANQTSGSQNKKTSEEGSEMNG